MTDHPSGTPVTLAQLVAERALDAELGALLWLLIEGGVPVVVAGDADYQSRAAVAGAVRDLGAGPGWVLLDEAELSLDALAGPLRQGTGLALTVAALDLRAVLARLEAEPAGLPADAVRRLGVVLIAEGTPSGLRITAAHYLRPTERDAEGHVQRRPPAVLATWDQEADRHEHFAWGITPELGDRVGRAQADLEERQRDRAAFLSRLVSDGTLDAVSLAERVAAYLATEPPRQPAVAPAPARPSGFRGGLTDPHLH